MLNLLKRIKTVRQVDEKAIADDRETVHIFTVVANDKILAAGHQRMRVRKMQHFLGTRHRLAVAFLVVSK